MKLDSFISELFRIGRFSIVGALATVIHLITSISGATFFLLPMQTANLVAFGMALGFSFLGHYYFTFQSNKMMRDVIPRFLITAISGYAASAGLLFLLNEAALSPQIKLVLAAMMVPIMSYIINRFWVF